MLYEVFEKRRQARMENIRLRLSQMDNDALFALGHEIHFAFHWYQTGFKLTRDRHESRERMMVTYLSMGDEPPQSAFAKKRDELVNSPLYFSVQTVLLKVLGIDLSLPSLPWPTGLNAEQEADLQSAVDTLQRLNLGILRVPGDQWNDRDAHLNREGDEAWKVIHGLGIQGIFVQDPRDPLTVFEKHYLRKARNFWGKPRSTL